MGWRAFLLFVDYVLRYVDGVYRNYFALPVYLNDGSLERYNVFRIEMLVRYASDDKLYLYDMVNTKKEKETSTPS